MKVGALPLSYRYRNKSRLFGAALQVGVEPIHRFFHPPLCPGAPPLERGAGPNSGPDWRESVGWKILLLLPASVSSGEGLRWLARPGR